MRLRSIFINVIFVVLWNSSFAKAENGTVQNVTSAKSPTLQPVHTPKQLMEHVNVGQTTTKTAENTSTSVNASLTTAPVVAVTPKPTNPTPKLDPVTSENKPASPAENHERKSKGREGVVNDNHVEITVLNNHTTPTAPTSRSTSSPKESSKNVTKPAVETNPPRSKPTTPSLITNSTTIAKPATTTTTTTTTPRPKKPTITYSIEDDPSIGNVTHGKLHDRNPAGGKLNVEEPDLPIAEPSMDVTMPPLNRNYFVSVVAIIFAIPIAMGAVTIMYRRFKDYWSTRHYRRMDFLVDGMYND